MASGRFGVLSSAANTYEGVGDATVEVSTINISVVNPGATDATIDIFIVDGDLGDRAAEDTICQGRIVEAKGEYERTGMVLSVGERVVFRSSISGVIVRVHGFDS